MLENETRGGRPKLSPEIKNCRREIERKARRAGLSFNPVIFEIVFSDEMGELAAYSGYPVRYHHWQFGQESLRIKQDEDWGLSKIYEMVIATNPVYAYLLAGNSLVVQKLVMAHVFGHADFFKNNIYFQDVPTNLHDRFGDNAERIEQIRREKGAEAVDVFLEACLSLASLFNPLESDFDFMNSKVGKKNHPIKSEVKKISPKDPLPDYMDRVLNPDEVLAEKKKKIEEEEELQSKIDRGIKIPAFPVRDVLGFILYHAPLEDWQQEIVRIIREEEQCLWKGGQTKIMNEGWASYWHAYLMAEDGVASDNEIVDFACLHSGVISGGGFLNPYRLGLQLWRDIKYRWDTGRHGEIWDQLDDLTVKNRWEEFIVFKTFFDKHRGFNEKTLSDWNEFCVLIQETQAGRGLVKPALFTADLFVSEWINYLRAGSRLKEMQTGKPDYWTDEEIKEEIKNCQFYLRLREKIKSGQLKFKEVPILDSWKEWAAGYQFNGRLGDGLKKIFEVRSTHNDVSFIQDFFTADFCFKHRYFTYGIEENIDWNSLEEEFYYVIRSLAYERVKRLILDQVINFGRPKIVIWDANHFNNGELRLIHLHDGRNLSRIEIGPVLQRLYMLWAKQKPVCLDSLLLRWPKGKHWWEEWEPGKKEKTSIKVPRAAAVRWNCDGEKTHKEFSGYHTLEEDVREAIPFKLPE